MLVRVERVESCGGTVIDVLAALWTTSALCMQPPVTSVLGCVYPPSVEVTMAPFTDLGGL